MPRREGRHDHNRNTKRDTNERWQRETAADEELVTAQQIQLIVHVNTAGRVPHWGPQHFRAATGQCSVIVTPLLLDMRTHL